MILDILRQAGEFDIVGLTDADPALHGTEVEGAMVLGSDEALLDLAAQGVHHVFLGVGGTGDNRARAAAFDAAQEIRNRYLTREEGVALARRFDGEFPKRYFKEILEYLSMTEEEFLANAGHFRSPQPWKKEGGDWKLRHKVE